MHIVKCKICKETISNHKLLIKKYPSYHCKPVNSSGNIGSKIALIGLAPGLHGANKTGIPFTSDFSGEIIRKILKRLSLQNIFISNVVRCYPKNNRPSSIMINNCHKHTTRELESLSNLKVVISLGTIAYYQMLKLNNLSHKNHKFYHGKITTLSLEALTGQAHPVIEILREDFPIIEVDGTLRDWEIQADNNNLAVAAAEYNLDASRQNLKARKSDHLPTLDLSGFYGHIVTAPIVNQGIQIFGGATDRTSLALSLNIPIYNGGVINSRRRAAEYQLLAAQESLELTKRQLTQNIRNAYRRVNTDVLVISQRQQSITSAQSALDATELGAEVGTRNIVEVLLARENLYRALRFYADARFDYVIDTLVLKQVAGILTPQDVINLNEWLQQGS